MNEQMNILHVTGPDGAEILSETPLRENDHFSIETVSQPNSGLELLSAGDFECVLTQYSLPDQNGVEFTATVRTEYPDLPVMLYTGQGTEAIASEAISAGVTEYIRIDGTGDYALSGRIRTAVEEYRRRQAIKSSTVSSAIHEHSPDGFIAINSDWRCTEINATVTSLIGESRDTVLGSHLWSLLPDLADSPIGETLRQTMETGETGSLTEYYPPHDNWYEVTVSPADEGIVAWLRDITTRKEHEQELTDTSQQFQAVLNTVEAAIFIKDTDSRYQLMNEECRRLLGVSPDEEVVGRTDHEFLPADVAERLQADDQQVLNREETVEIEEEIPTPTGTQINLTLKSPFYDETGALLGVCAVSTDITERKAQQEKIKRQNERLEQFTSVVSHDLRTPVQNVQSGLDLARTECDSQYLEKIQQATDRMDQLIDDLLDLAKYGEEITEKEAVPLADTVEESWPSGVSGTLEFPSTLPTIEADKSRFRQLLENLFRNAIDHSTEGVTVRVGLTGPDAQPTGIYVADDGPGIEPQRRDKILDHGYTDSEEGTGFGLSIVKRVVEAHNWELSVAESWDGGTQIEITGIDIPPE
jgi:PAS domain S-box-containing protein